MLILSCCWTFYDHIIIQSEIRLYFLNMGLAALNLSASCEVNLHILMSMHNKCIKCTLQIWLVIQWFIARMQFQIYWQAISHFPNALLNNDNNSQTLVRPPHQLALLRGLIFRNTPYEGFAQACPYGHAFFQLTSNLPKKLLSSPLSMIVWSTASSKTIS